MDGIIVTKLDGDSRGGAALSMRAITQKPIKFIGMGEKSSELEIFDPKRIANRILGMGDIVSLVEKAQEQLDSEKAQRMIKRLEKGQFNMNDLRLQLEQTVKMGGMQGMIGMMPGLGKLAKQIENSNIDDNVIKKQIALITSMTKKERANPQILQASRKKRIAMGSGQEVSELNKLVKMHRQMADMMKKMGRKGNRGMLRSLVGDLTGLGKGKQDLDGLLNPNSGLSKEFDANFKSKNLTRMMGNLPNFMKKN